MAVELPSPPSWTGANAHRFIANKAGWETLRRLLHPGLKPVDGLAQRAPSALGDYYKGNGDRDVAGGVRSRAGKRELG